MTSNFRNQLRSLAGGSVESTQGYGTPTFAAAERGEFAPIYDLCTDMQTARIVFRTGVAKSGDWHRNAARQHRRAPNVTLDVSTRTSITISVENRGDERNPVYIFIGVVRDMSRESDKLETGSVRDVETWLLRVIEPHIFRPPQSPARDLSQWSASPAPTPPPPAAAPATPLPPTGRTRVIDIDDQLND